MLTDSKLNRLDRADHPYEALAAWNTKHMHPVLQLLMITQAPNFLRSDQTWARQLTCWV